MAALIQFASGAPGIKYQLDKRFLMIGRGMKDNDICLPCGFVSKHHAMLEVAENPAKPDSFEFYLEDLSSTNHTYVNDQPITRVRLEDGDVIRIGQTTLKFDAHGEIPVLDALEVDFELPSSSQSKTWNFSRRLRLIGTE